MNKRNSLYFHVPFCLKRCSFCRIENITERFNREHLVQYWNRLLEDFRNQKTEKQFNTVEFGGGTPSLIPAHDIVSLIQSIKKDGSIVNNAQITIEVTPATATKKYLKQIKEGGVNRISLGIQSVLDNELEAMGRIYNRKSIEKAINNIDDTEFESFNIDVIYGLPSQSVESWIEGLKYLLSSGLTSITMFYFKKDSLRVVDFVNDTKKLGLKYPSFEEIQDMYDKALRHLEQKGFIRESFATFYNNGIPHQYDEDLFNWNSDVLGIGAGALSIMGDKIRISDMAPEVYIVSDEKKYTSYSLREYGEFYIRHKLMFDGYVAKSVVEEKTGRAYFNHMKRDPVLYNVIDKLKRINALIEDENCISLNKENLVFSVISMYEAFFEDYNYRDPHLKFIPQE